MPMIPEFQVSPGAVPGAPSPAQASPGAWGMVGDQQAAGGAQFGNSMAEFNARYQESKRAMDAAARIAQFSKDSGDLVQNYSTHPLADPVTGLPSREATTASFNDSIEGFKQKALAGITNPLELAHVTSQVGQTAIVHGLAVQDAAFRLESSGQVGKLEQLREQYANDAATAGTDLGQKLSIDQYTAANKAATAGGWQTPEAEARNDLLFKSRIAEVGIRQQLNAALDPDNRDPDVVTKLARDVADPSQFTSLLPETRVALGQHLESTAYRLLIQQSAKIARDAAQAEKDHRAAQAFNFSQDFAAALAGNGPNASQVADAVAKQRYSPEAANAILSARSGRDDPMATVQLWQHVGDGTARPDDIAAALSAGKISGPTGADMIKAVTAKDRGVDNQTEHSAFATLRTALGGDAVDKGLVDFGNTDQVKQALGWAQAQGEWTRRVVAGTEDPQAVLADMVNRYQRPDHPPATWDRPRLGGVFATKDVADVWAKTQAAHDAGQMGEDQFNAQAALLNQYRQFFADQDSRNAAVAAAQAGAPKPVKSGAPGGGQ